MHDHFSPLLILISLSDRHLQAKPLPIVLLQLCDGSLGSPSLSPLTGLRGKAEMAVVHGLPGAAGPLSVPARPHLDSSLLRDRRGAQGRHRRPHDR